MVLYAVFVYKKLKSGKWLPEIYVQKEGVYLHKTTFSGLYMYIVAYERNLIYIYALV